MAQNEIQDVHPMPINRLMVVIPAALIASAALSLIFMTSLYGRPNYKVGMYDAIHQPVASIQYRGSRMAVAGQPRAMTDEGMVAVGYSDEGYLLYAPRTELGGGGGGKPEWGAKAPAFQHLFLRTDRGAYQPLTH